MVGEYSFEFVKPAAMISLGLPFPLLERSMEVDETIASMLDHCETDSGQTPKQVCHRQFAQLH